MAGYLMLSPFLLTPNLLFAISTLQACGKFGILACEVNAPIAQEDRASDS